MLIAFVVVSWVTVIVASVPALREAIEKEAYVLRSRARGNQNITPGIPQDPERQSNVKTTPFQSIAKKCEKLLDPLCDLQAVTGISIIVAGWVQIDTIDYYHQELVMAYWWLTLNSFWAGRNAYLGFGLNPRDEKKSKGEKVRALMRVVIAFLSCVLALSFQGFILVREENWDDYGGPCNRYRDGSSPIPWMIGVCLFCIALLSVIFTLICSLAPSTNFGKNWELHAYYSNAVETVANALRDWYKSLRADLAKFLLQPANTQTPHRILKRLKLSLWIGFSGSCRALWFLLVLWLAVWSYGDSFLPATWLILVIFNVWNTFDVLDLRLLNQPIIKDKEVESRMGFGQILPLVMITSIIFNTVDQFFGEAPSCIITK